MADKQLTDWLRRVHETTRWTTSVCSGALILAAAGLLEGLPATTHWYVQSGLAALGAKPQRGERIVHAGKIATAAGVSAGIDLGLWLAGQIAGREHAEMIQLHIEYDPQPPFDAGHPSKASETVIANAKTMLRKNALNPSELRAYPVIAWQQALARFRKRRGLS
jgi:transcriptional regulator GlxA family with amidase domain